MKLDRRAFLKANAVAAAAAVSGIPVKTLPADSKNESTCPDCHVPREWWPKIVRKVQASNELWHKLIGSIDTPEKFQAKRLKLAESEWARMKANDSQECRNCHRFEYMDFSEQGRRAVRTHSRAFDEGKTCIECHQGIAHQLPPIYQEIGAPRGVAARAP